MDKRNFGNKWESESKNLEICRRTANSSKAIRQSQTNETKRGQTIVGCKRVALNERKPKKVEKYQIKKRLEELDKESKKIIFRNLQNKRKKEQNFNTDTRMLPLPIIKNNVKTKSTNIKLDKASNDSICSSASSDLSMSKNTERICRSEPALSNTNSNELANSVSAIKVLIFKSLVTKTRLKYLYWIRQHVQQNYKGPRLPFSQKFSPPKKYPYNFISAVRRKLKTFLRCNMSNWLLDDKGFSQHFPQTITTRCNLCEGIQINSQNSNICPRDCRKVEMLISQNTITQGSEDETTVSSSILNGTSSWQQTSLDKSDPQPNAALLQKKIESSLAKMESQTSLAKLLFDFNQRLQNAIEINEKLKCKKYDACEDNTANHSNYNNHSSSSSNFTTSYKNDVLRNKHIDASSRKDINRTRGLILSNSTSCHALSSNKSVKSPSSRHNVDLNSVGITNELNPTLPTSTRTNRPINCDNLELITQSDFDLNDQLTNSEITKSEQLKFLLKFREKLLVDRAKSKIAWLELQKERLKTKGLKQQISAAKKKQRSILIKMEKDLKEMKKLFKFNERTSETSSMQSQKESQSSSRLVKKKKATLTDIYLKPLKVSEIAELSLDKLSPHLPISLKLKESNKKPERLHLRMRRLLKYIEKSLTFLDEGENCNCVEYVYTTGAKLNKLWERLTMENIEQFESNKCYKLCRKDFKGIYEEAKKRLSFAITTYEYKNLNGRLQSSQSGGSININVLRQVNTGSKRDATNLLKLSELKVAIIETKENIKDVNWSSIKMLLRRIHGDQTFLSEMTEYVAASISFNTLRAESKLNLKYLKYHAKNMPLMKTIERTHDVQKSNEIELEKFDLINNAVNKLCPESPNMKCINSVERISMQNVVKSSQPVKFVHYAQTEKILENGNTIPSFYIREIPNKPPPPYVPPAPGSPMTTIFPSEERIRCLTYRRSHELFCNLSNTDYVNEKGDPLPSVMNEQITNIYERIVLEICQEWIEEHMDVLNERDPCNFHSCLALYNPPNRLRSIQNSIYKEVRYALTMEKKSSNHSQPHLIYGNRNKRDHIEKIIIQELFDEDKQWDSFLCKENEVLKLIIDSMIEQYVEQIVEETWAKAEVQ